MIMSEQTIPIPGRLKNVAIGGHVAGSEDIDAGEGKTQKQVNDETNATLALHQSEISGLNSQNYVSVSSYSSLPATGSADTIYRVSSWDGNANSGEGAADVTKYTEYAWNGTAYIVVSVKTQIGEVFDISEYKAVGGTLATFENLSAALDNGNNVPAGIRKGGMSVKFVQSSDNRYVQARLMANTFTTDVTQWQGVDKQLISGSKNLIENNAVAREIGGIESDYHYDIQYDGYSISRLSGNPNTGGDNIYYCITTPFLLHKGDTVKTVSGGVRYCAIGGYNGEGNPYTVLVNIDNTPGTATYTANEDIVIACCGLKSDFKVYLTEGLIPRIKNLELNKADKTEVPTIVEDILGTDKDEQYEYDIQYDGYYIGRKSGNKSQESADCITSPILLKAGDTIEVASSEVRICAIGGYNGDDSPYTVLAVINDTAGTATYTTTRNMQVVACGKKSDLSVVIINSSVNNNISKLYNLTSNLEEEKENKSELLEDVDNILNNNKTIINDYTIQYDDSTIGRVSGNINSGGSNVGYCVSYPINLSIGDTISVTSSGIRLCAIGGYNGVGEPYSILVNIDDVAGTATYTAEENIDVAICGLKSDLSVSLIRKAVNKKIDELYANKANKNEVPSFADVKELISVGDAYIRNSDKEPMLVAACRLNKNTVGYKDLQLAIITDEHADIQSVKNVVTMANGFSTIDAIINCGDLVASRMGGEESVVTQFNNAIENSTKPVFSIIGNHDVGNSDILGYLGGDYTYVHNLLIKPMYDKGILSSSEYQANKNYYYKDFATRKIRMIVLDQYNSPLDAKDDDNWEVITYNSSLPLMVYGTSYTQGTELNFSNYTKASFRLKVNLTVTISKTPKLKIPTGDTIVMQEQAEWLLSTLIATPSNYNIILAMHTKFSIDAVPQTQFAFDSGYEGGAWAGMTKTWLSSVIHAYNNRQVLSLDIEALGNASYLNSGGIWYHLDKDFTGVTNKILFAIGGHVHYDSVFKDTNIYQICPTCSSTDPNQVTTSRACDDIRRTVVDGRAYDCITVVSARTNAIALVKLGVNVTERGIKRDYEVIPFEV